MTQITGTLRRNRSAPVAVAGLAAMAVMAAALIGTQLHFGAAAPTTMRHSIVTPGDIVGNLNSEYLIVASRDWVVRPDRKAQVRGELNSEYLLDASRRWFTPAVSHAQFVRGELNSEYLRRAALDW